MGDLVAGHGEPPAAQEQPGGEAALRVVARGPHRGGGEEAVQSVAESEGGVPAEHRAQEPAEQVHPFQPAPYVGGHELGVEAEVVEYPLGLRQHRAGRVGGEQGGGAERVTGVVEEPNASSRASIRSCAVVIAGSRSSSAVPPRVPSAGAAG
ncbi:hypothetical protein ACFQ0Q_30170 [Streptomyces aureus]